MKDVRRRRMPYVANHGVVLIEIVVVLALTAAISGIAIAGIAASFRYGQQSASHRNGQTALFRISNTLRSEIHRAEVCHWDADNNRLQLKLPSEELIDYQVFEDRWVRKQNVPNEEPTITSLGISNDYQVHCNLDTARQGKLISLQVTTKNDLETDQERKVHRTLECSIVAIVGKDYLLLHE